MKITIGELKRVVREANVGQRRKHVECPRCHTYHFGDTCPLDDGDGDDLPPANVDALDVPRDDRAYHQPRYMRRAA